MPSPVPPLLVPPSRLLVTGRQEGGKNHFARRISGSADWLLIYTEQGRAYFRFSGGEYIAGPGDLVLIKPGTPHDYGIEESHGYWKNTWIHFLPRPDCLPWLQWPERAPGLMSLSLPSSLRRPVLKELEFMGDSIKGSGRRQEELAANALERVILLCDSINPRHIENKGDQRIRKAVDILSRRYHEPFTLDEVAKSCGLSRSRLAELFQKETGTTPMKFLENTRLRRAGELLKHTSLRLEEIAGQVGFSNSFYLSLRFKKFSGLNPRAYRGKHSRS
jgi:AraC family transcriptional regulator of arabinose operon